ncbi:MAG: hypothetical protein J2P17_28050 [Mycobacterium sp.]|nr:hypothetical protein [Mycobacterium sp.]
MLILRALRRRLRVFALIALPMTAVIAMTSAAHAAAKPRYAGFVVVGGPAHSAAWKTAVRESARTGATEVFDSSTGTYVPETARTLSTASGYHLPEGVRRSDYVWQQNTATSLGVVAEPDQDIVAQVNIKIRESITGNTSDYWKYDFTLDQSVGEDLWKLDVGYQCAVNETGQSDDYCQDITYPDGSQETGLTPPTTQEVHDLAVGNTVNAAVSGFFGTHSTPPPSGSKRVVKFAMLTEFAEFPDYGVVDHGYIRMFDVCVPNKVSFSNVKLCQYSGTGD